MDNIVDQQFGGREKTKPLKETLIGFCIGFTIGYISLSLLSFIIGA